MALTLHLGVLDVPYSDEPGVTTGDVAEFLEAKYHPLQTFYDQNEGQIGEHIAEGMRGALETLVMGGQASGEDFYGAGTAKIEDDLKQFIATGQMEQLGLEGVPTKAAIERRSSRFKSKRGPDQRPSFVDTGLYQSALKVWADPQD